VCKRGDDRGDLAKLLGELGNTFRTWVAQLLVQRLPQGLTQGLGRARGSRETLGETGVREIVAHRP
jgi:hypothetical protein